MTDTTERTAHNGHTEVGTRVPHPLVSEINNAVVPLVRPAHRIEGITNEWPTGLKSLEDAARDLGISVDRLMGLADGGYAPHFRVDGGPPQFKIGDLKRWAAVNLVDHVYGRDLPSPVRIIAPAPARSLIATSMILNREHLRHGKTNLRALRQRASNRDNDLDGGLLVLRGVYR